MANLYYTHTTFPVANTNGSSASMRGELNSVMAGFDLLPDPLGVGSKGFSGGRWDSGIFVNGTVDNTPIGATARSTIRATTLDLTGAATLGAGATLTGILNASGGAQITGFAISGGSIDNVPIGNTTRNTIKGTTLDMNGLATLGAGLNLTGVLNALSGSFELGNAAVVNSPFLDFHSSGAGSSFDARLIATGGGAADGQGTLTFKGAAFAFDFRPTWQGGMVPWDSSNLPAPMQTTGATMTGALTLKGGAGAQFSPLLTLQSNNGAFQQVLRSNNAGSGTLDLVNSAGTFTNLSVRDTDGFLTVRGGATFGSSATFGARPAWAGLTPWDNGNLTNLNQLTNGPGYLTAGGTINLATNANKILNDSAYMSLHFNNIGANPTYVWVNYNDANNSYLTTPGSLSVNFANFANSANTANSVGGVSNPATAGAQTQWSTGVAEVGIGGNNTVAEMGAPWVAEGWHNIGGLGSGAQAMRFVALRNQ